MEKKNNIGKFFFSTFSAKNQIGIQTICYSINLVLPTLILLVASFNGYYVFTAELGIIIGINIIITQIFSANARSLIILKESRKLVSDHIFFRLLISLVLVFLNLIILYTFSFNNQILLILIVLMIVFQWINEIILSYLEIKKKNKFFYYYLIPTIGLILVIFFKFNIFAKSLLIILSYNIFIILFVLTNSPTIKNLNIKKNFYENFKKIIKQTSFFSSFCISFANLVWRLFIISTCGKILAGIYFASFAIASFPGTMFNISYGPTILRKNITLKKVYIYLALLLLFFSLLILAYLSFQQKDFIFIKESSTQIFATLVSLGGSVFMLRGLYIRQYILQKTKFQEKIFKIDIIYAIMIGLIVPLLYFIGGQKLIILSFFISSIISYLIYKFSFKNLK